MKNNKIQIIAIVKILIDVAIIVNTIIIIFKVHKSSSIFLFSSDENISQQKLCY